MSISREEAERERRADRKDDRNALHNQPAAAAALNWMRVPARFGLYREHDVTGVSGKGFVAHGVQFPDGSCVLRWDTKVNSTVFYQNINDLKEIHGHDGATRVVWID